jgi:hypothetical protein
MKKNISIKKQIFQSLQVTSAYTAPMVGPAPIVGPAVPPELRKSITRQPPAMDVLDAVSSRITEPLNLAVRTLQEGNRRLLTGDTITNTAGTTNFEIPDVTNQVLGITGGKNGINRESNKGINKKDNSGNSNTTNSGQSEGRSSNSGSNQHAPRRLIATVKELESIVAILPDLTTMSQDFDRVIQNS